MSAKADRSETELLDAIERWHLEAPASQLLHEYLGWTWEQYAHWVETNEQPVEREGVA